MTRQLVAIVLLTVPVASSCRGRHPSESRAHAQLSPGPPPSRSGAPSEPLLALEPVTPSAGADDIRFWATLRNAEGTQCRPFFVDSVVSESTPDLLLAPRPTTVIALTIRDAEGRVVDARYPGGGKDAPLRAHQLALLQCGQGYSWEVRPARLPWGYKLTPGRYMARVSVQVPIASFVKWHLTLENAIAELWPSVDQTEFGYLRDAATAPAEIGFTVTE